MLESGKKIGIRKLALATLLTSIIGVSMVYAFSVPNVTWSAPVTLEVTSPDVKVYWDENCTELVTSLDFGTVKPEALYEFKFYVKNIGGSGAYVWWNSTLSSVTTKISEYWYNLAPYSGYLNGTFISAGVTIPTLYRIIVHWDISPGTYSWTLYLGLTTPE